MPDDILWPQDHAAEAACLGTVLQDGAEAVVGLGLDTADFWTPEHAELWRVLVEMARAGQGIDLVTVSGELLRRGLLDRIGRDKTDVGGKDYLIDLTEAGGLQAAAYAETVRECARRRRLIQAGRRLADRAAAPGRDTAAAIAAETLSELADVGNRRDRRGAVVSAGQAVGEAVAHADAVARGDVPPGLMTGFRGIDVATSGLQPGDLWVVGAGTSVGKTAFALAVAAHAARAGEPVLIVSAEMTARQIGFRLLAMTSGVERGRLARGNLDEHETSARDAAQREIAAWPLDILAKAATVSEIRVRAGLAAARRGRLGLVVADYLQLLPPESGDTRAQQIGGIAWGLKTLAMDLPSPVLLLSQLNRAGLRAADDTRPPALIDLKESGDVENHASVVLLLHLPADPVPDTAGAVPIWCRVAKARDGMVTPWPAPRGRDLVPGSITLRFRPECVRFEQEGQRA